MVGGAVAGKRDEWIGLGTGGFLVMRNTDLLMVDEGVWRKPVGVMAKRHLSLDDRGSSSCASSRPSLLSFSLSSW
jgi:hypothetical protein